MFDGKLFDFKIDCALPFSWEKGRAYARARSFDALSFRLKGNADYYHEKKHYHVDKNDILFVPANYDYVIDPHCSEQVLVIHFNIKNSCFTEMKTFTPTNPDVFERSFSAICRVWNNKPTGYAYKLAELFYGILEEIEIQKTENDTSPKLQKAINFMQKNFCLPETNVEAVAEHVGVSTVYLRKIFNKNMHVTPIEYLRELRLDHACELLKTGYYSVEDVATLSGFSDAKYFSITYKKRKGVSPSKDFKKAFSHSGQT